MAITNVSASEKTIKNQLKVMESDNYTIDKALLYCKYGETANIIEIENILDNYRDYFDKNLIEVDVPKKFYYQPAAFAENYYGTPDLDFLVLYFARMSSMFEFIQPKIKVVPRSDILKINKLFVAYSKDVRDSYNNPKEYK